VTFYHSGGAVEIVKPQKRTHGEEV